MKGVSGFPDFAFKMVRFPYFESDSFRVAGLRMLDEPGSNTIKSPVTVFSDPTLPGVGLSEMFRQSESSFYEDLSYET